jgi:hypothetical protein
MHRAARVELRLAEWESVASEASQFVMIAGHPCSEGGSVVGSIDAFGS